MNQGTVSSQINETSAYVTFSHPAGNSCTSKMLADLCAEIDDLSRNDSIRAIVLQSPEHTAFCAGANLSEVVSLSNMEESKEFFMGFARLILSIKKSSKLLIARVHSKAVGGGVGIIAACDMAFATRKSSLRLSEINLGIAPLVIAPALMRKMGVSAFSTLSLNPTDWLDSQWAYQRGLYTQKYDSLEALDEDLNRRLEGIGSWSPLAMKELKSSLWETTTDWEQLLESKAAATAKLALSDYTQEQLKKYRK
jgi:methylglutaconyl-CoA hydratase